MTDVTAVIQIEKVKGEGWISWGVGSWYCRIGGIGDTENRDREGIGGVGGGVMFRCDTVDVIPIGGLEWRGGWVGGVAEGGILGDWKGGRW